MYEGWTVPIDYDALLAKLIGYGSDRAETIGRLRRALNEYFVGGIKTNISLFRRILNDTEFQAGNVDTGFLDRLLTRSPALERSSAKDTDIAAVAAGIFEMLDANAKAANGSNGAYAQNGNASASWKRAGRLEGLSSG
jgi:acetyl-CoA carboxylase biotin carboxylase subunit